MGGETTRARPRPEAPRPLARSMGLVAAGLLAAAMSVTRLFATSAQHEPERAVPTPHAHAPSPAPDPGRHQRREDDREPPLVAVRPVLFTIIGFLAFVAVSLVGLRAYYAWDGRGPVVTPPRPFAPPRLQTDPVGDLNRLKAQQRAQLTGYGWVDRDRGLARIPIERAMDMIAARGPDAYAPLDPPAAPSPVREPEKAP
jgi:hypothetical protein